MDCSRLALDTRPATEHLRRIGRCLIVAGMALSANAGAQTPTVDSGRPLAAVIDDYVREGLKSNLALRAQSLEVERSVAALDEARARYFPEAGFAARYTRAEGGRTIELPLGQALNPAYQTLNDLLVAQGQQPQFPVVQDETIAFLREREQDTRITLRMPLLAPSIPAAVRAQRELLGASEYAHVALGRRLKRDITVGYLHWLAAVRNKGIVDASVALLNENLRVNDSLFRNGKITQDQVLRARAELLEVTQQSREAENAAAQSRSYLNFLLNRSLDSPRGRWRSKNCAPPRSPIGPSSRNSRISRGPARHR
jgi:outer membrane protein